MSRIELRPRRNPHKFYYTITCCCCGRFCRPVDTGNRYGTASDTEPPEEVFWCRKCAKKEMSPARIIFNGNSGCWWVKPNFVSVAKSILRNRRKREAAKT